MKILISMDGISLRRSLVAAKTRRACSFIFFFLADVPWNIEIGKFQNSRNFGTVLIFHDSNDISYHTDVKWDYSWSVSALRGSRELRKLDWVLSLRSQRKNSFVLPKKQFVIGVICEVASNVFCRGFSLSVVALGWRRHKGNWAALAAGTKTPTQVQGLKVQSPALCPSPQDSFSKAPLTTSLTLTLKLT